ncbi:MAG: ClbS/DfsB family four-helix bundle protein [Sulfitobacter sp.]
MPAKTKSELLNVTQNEYAKLTKLIGGIETKTALKKREEDTSIKDVIAHRAHWIDLFLGWYVDGVARKTVHFPAKGYKWNDLKRYNTELRKRQADLDWPEAVAMLQESYEKLSHFIQDRSEQELYGGPMKGAYNAWTPGRWAEAAGPSHFRSASKYLRACLRG